MPRHADNHRSIQTALAVGAGLLVAACGGGGSAMPAGGATPDNTGTAVVTASNLSGAVVKGPVNGATVCAYTLIPAGKGDKLACTTTKADGSYDLQVTFAGPVLVEATGGTYTDEATGTANVPLAEPLRVVGMVAAGSQTLVPTPLTELAVRKVLTGGGLTIEAFKSAAADVGTAFGLPPDVDPAKAMPSVTGHVNAYGTALIGISKMLSKGATLGGILANGDLGVLKQGLEKATSSACNLPRAQQLTAAPSGSVDFVVVSPQPAWRGLLPASGTAMGCVLESNTAAEVRLTCPSAALVGGLAIDIDPAAQVTDLPSSGVLLVGGGVAAGDVTPSAGTVSFGGSVSAALSSASVTVNAGNVTFDGGVPIGGGAITPTLPGVLNLCTLASNGGVGLGNVTLGSVKSGSLGGNITLGGGGVVTGGGAVSGGGNVTLGGGNVTLGAGNVTVGGGGGIVTTGGGVNPAGGSLSVY